MTKMLSRNYGCRIWEVVINGLNAIILENDLIRVGLLIDKGTDIFEFLYKPTDTDFLWRSWLGLRNEGNHNLSIASKNGAFLDYYFGGWQELFPSTDEPCVYKGAELGIHGEVCLLPWEYSIIEDSPEKIKVKFSVTTIRTPFKIEKTLSLIIGKAILFFEERVQNISNEEMDFTWGLHPALGEPFLTPNCKVYLPSCSIKTDELLDTEFSRIAINQNAEWPFVKGKDGSLIDLRLIPTHEIQSNDRIMMHNFDNGWYAVKNQKSKMVFGMRWEKEVFPYLLYWQSFNGWKGYPFYGTAYTISLEPRSSYPFPLTRAIKENTQKKLKPKSSIKTRYLAVAGVCRGDVKSITEDGSFEVQTGD